jgi:hypothetical protein
VQGRITERHLDLAEQSFPGIGAVYRNLRSKPLTFLDLVWIYETDLNAASTSRGPSRRRLR